MSAEEGCRDGRVTVVVKAAAATLSRRAVRLGSGCAYKSVVRIARSRIGKRAVSVRAYFTGNEALQRRTSQSVVAR